MERSYRLQDDPERGEHIVAEFSGIGFHLFRAIPAGRGPMCAIEGRLPARDLPLCLQSGQTFDSYKSPRHRPVSLTVQKQIRIGEKMNQNLKQSVWVLALGMAFTGLGTSRLTAAVPAQQGQDQDRNENEHGPRWFFQQGLQDGQHDRQYGGNRSDHRQPQDANDLSAYRDGYKHGYRNIPTNQRNEQNRTMEYFEQGLRDGQHDRQYGGNRTDHQQPNGGDDQTAYRDGYKHGYRNIPTNQPNERPVSVNYFEQGLRDGQSDRQTGSSRSDHQQPNDPNDLRAYRDGYKQGFRDTNGRNN
jgi:hypothetical protein